MATTNQIEKALIKILDDIRADEKKLCEEIGIRYRDPVADVQIWVKSKEKVTLTYDGAGYDLFSLQGGMEHPITGEWMFTAKTYRDKIDAALKKIDPKLYFEDENSWSLTVCL